MLDSVVCVNTMIAAHVNLDDDLVHLTSLALRVSVAKSASSNVAGPRRGPPAATSSVDKASDLGEVLLL